MASSDRRFFRRLPPRPGFGDEKGGEGLEAVIKSPRNQNLRDTMIKAMADSHPTGKIKSSERGVLIRQNARGDVWGEPYFPTPNDKENHITVPQRAEWEKIYDWIVGVQTIGTAHSHVGEERGKEEPSPKDRATAGRGLHVPGVIMTRDGLYYHGPAMPPPRAPGWQFWK